MNAKLRVDCICTPFVIPDGAVGDYICPHDIHGLEENILNEKRLEIVGPDEEWKHRMCDKVNRWVG